jgi:hypothetical protein
MPLAKVINDNFGIVEAFDNSACYNFNSNDNRWSFKDWEVDVQLHVTFPSSSTEQQRQLEKLFWIKR